MKKLLAMLLVLAMALGVAPAFAEEAETYELALVTDVGTIDDKSFNQGAWEGLMQYAEENGITYKYYQPPQQTDEDYLAAMAAFEDAPPADTGISDQTRIADALEDMVALSLPDAE